MFPFALFFLKTSKNKIEIFSFYLIAFSIFLFIFLTNSRNGLLGLVIILFSYYRLNKVLIIFLSGVFFTSITEFVLQFINPSLSIINWLPIGNLLNKISNLNFNFDSSPRFIIFKSSLSLIKRRPFLGWGASTFPHLHSNAGSSVEAQHTHNIFLELAHNFGLPLSILICSSIVVLLVKLFKSITKNKNQYKIKLLEKSWLISTSLVLILHISDITLYDGKLNLLICILLAGSRAILNSHKNSYS